MGRRPNNNNNNNDDDPVEEGTNKASSSPLNTYFLVVLMGFAFFSIWMNTHYAVETNTAHHQLDHDRVSSVLGKFRQISAEQQLIDKVYAQRFANFQTDAPSNEDSSNIDNDDDGNPPMFDKAQKKDRDEEAKEEAQAGGDTAKPPPPPIEEKRQQQHKIANLNCAAYGGPSEKEAEEMVYWEDIPEDALHMSPFHLEHPKKKNKKKVQKITQFFTFEPDAGGWNNIRMAMETVLAMSFAMGRTLVLPPHQGMYLIDKDDGNQKSKFSFDHFFHMESISHEHIGLDIISTKEFLERCLRGDIVDADGEPLLPPGNRTDWDGAPNPQQRELRWWMRDNAGENLVHFDPDNCMVAFPATASLEDANELEQLPDIINKLPGSWPHHEQYVGKPQAVDAPVVDRLKEMNADRGKLCLYTHELQQEQWVHFPVGMETPTGDTSRLLVHFYAFLFFQDWKQDLWMKRFVRDHVRYIDEIQCAAARVVAKLRQRVRERTSQSTDKFDTIHVRRGDFQFKETRVDAPAILDSLKKVLSKNTTLYIATDERDKAFFRPIVDYFADVAFLDDFVESELRGVNTNYFGMIDQLVSSRGDVFFGCWFSTFTGYINRLRGYHTDDHELSGFEQGIIPSYYYAGPEPDRFDHMREYWPIKKQFYAREFPTSWRLIDQSI